ncbi:hypothetical protein ACFLZR_00670 [Candidatus Neomarinimicrobiota bacterium]
MTVPGTPWVATRLWLEMWQTVGPQPHGFRPLDGESTPPVTLLRQLQEMYTHGQRKLVVADLGQSSQDSPWAFIADGINRTGNNPLRGLGDNVDHPFLDTSHLYYVPPGYKGITVVAVGDRKTSLTDALTCSYGHTLALLGHAAKLKVIGLLFAEDRFPAQLQLLPEIQILMDKF